MRSSYLFLAVPLFLGTTLSAAPCGAGSLQSYVNLGVAGCSVGTVDYRSFQIVPGQNGATVINPANVTVTPGGTLFNTTLMLGLTDAASAGQLLDLIFRVQASGLLTAATVSLNSPTITGDGSATGFLDVCGAGSFTGNSPTGCSTTKKSAVASATAGGPNQLMDGVTFPPSSFFDIFFDVTLDGGSAGRAAISSATLGVNAVPEPSATVLMVLGIGAIGCLRLLRHR